MIDQDRGIAASPQDRLDDDGRLVVIERRANVADVTLWNGATPVEARPTEPAAGSQSSLALHNLRGAVILIVLAFHSCLAYLGSSASSPFPFDQSPYEWRAFPIIDSHRWLGFDLFAAWQDVYLMSLMFFLSALFAWPSLTRKGSRKFLSDRALRLGLPFVFGVTIVAPLALYPVYRTTASDPTLAAYARHFLALPFWPNGPMWFLWELLAFTVLGAGLRHILPDGVAFLGRASASANRRPLQCFLFFAAASALVYVPLAIAFTPWRWSDHGPFALQFSRPLFYASYYILGFGVGAYGLERGLLAVEGILARRWLVWLALALGSLMLWMGLTALTMQFATSVPLPLQIAADAGYVVACASSVFFVIGLSLRFGAIRSPVLDNLSKNAMGMYLLHYAPVVWLQYALMDAAAPAVAKAAVVFAGALVLSWAATAAIRALPFGCRLIGEEPPIFAGAPSRRIGFAWRRESRAPAEPSPQRWEPSGSAPNLFDPTAPRRQ
jgi:surface polysaccharide O-acyltransferase-like enzyme